MKKVSTIDVRQRIGDLLNRVALRHDEFVIERKGKPLAALVPVERLEQMRRFARRHALELLEEQKQSTLSEERALAIGLEGQRSGVCKDPDDDKYVAAALEGRAAYVVTGDRAFLDLREHAGVEIVSPPAFLDLLGS